MTNWDEALTNYDNLVKNNQYHNISKIYCLYRVEESIKWLKIQETISQEDKKRMAIVIYDYYLELEDVQISRISDIICEHWEEYQQNDDFDICDYLY